MDRLRRLFVPSDDASYERLGYSDTRERRTESRRRRNGGEDDANADADEDEDATHKSRAGGSGAVEYSIFLLLGISMLWAWNMFLAAGPYFRQRFQGAKWIARNFQAAEVSVSTAANLGSMLVLARLQANASYPRRIVASLLLNLAVFALLALSTVVPGGAGAYFTFLLLMMALSSLATGLCQNGLFAYAAGFAEPRYTQAIMTGQAVAGVLPCILEIVSVLSLQGERHSSDKSRSVAGRSPKDVTTKPPSVPWTAALAYFITATAISIVTLLAFGLLHARNRAGTGRVRRENAAVAHGVNDYHDNADDDDDDDGGHDGGGEIDRVPREHARKAIPLLVLARKLRWLASAVFVTFLLTMAYPVYTQQIVSVRPADEQPALLRPASFVPLALLFWNAGDLLGRLASAGEPALALARRPRLVLALATARVVFVAMYHLCNIGGRGAVVPSDFFYLVVVQLFFGLSSGFLGSTCMIGAGQWVEEEEREAAGGFMGLCLVAGLAAGSLLSFALTKH